MSRPTLAKPQTKTQQKYLQICKREGASPLAFIEVSKNARGVEVVSGSIDGLGVVCYSNMTEVVDFFAQGLYFATRGDIDLALCCLEGVEELHPDLMKEIDDIFKKIQARRAEEEEVERKAKELVKELNRQAQNKPKEA